MIPPSDLWDRLASSATPKRRGPTPESDFQKIATAYLKLWEIGEVIRVNTGQAWMGASQDGHYRGRPVRFGEVGHSDLVVRQASSPIQVFIETKRPGWKVPSPPKAGASASTLKKFHGHLAQERFLEARRAQGHVALFAQSLEDIRAALSANGFRETARAEKYRRIHSPRPLERPRRP